MPILAGWLTGEQVSQEIIEQTLAAMGAVLGQHGGQPAQTIQPGAGLIAFSDPAYAMQQNHEPPVLDWVPDRRTLVYRRPLSGMHALYYIENWPAEGNLLFASEIKALLAVGVPRRLHLAALAALSRYGFIPAPWTAFKEIRVVPAGSILRWQRAKTVVNHATDYHLDEPYPQPASADHLDTLLNETIPALLPPHEQLVALTGGGQPSALSTLLAARHTTTPFSIASLGYTNAQSSRTWKQVEHIAATAALPLLAINGVDQPEFWTATLAATEAPSIDTRPLAWHQLLHTASSETGARVAVSGLGAHILIGTAMSRLAGRYVKTTQENMLSAYAHMLTGPSNEWIPPLWSQDAGELLQKEERWEDSLHARKLARRAGQFQDQQQGYYYLDLHLRLPDLLVNVAQQVAMQERMVVRSPYLHTATIDMLTRLPAVLHDDLSKSQLFSSLIQRYVTDSGKESVTLPLVAPTSSLTQIDGSELLQQTLSLEALQATNIFDPQVVKELMQHSTRGKVAPELLLVFTTQLLCQLFGVTL